VPKLLKSVNFFSSYDW